MTLEYWLWFYHLLWPMIAFTVTGGLILNAFTRRRR
jgi:hypothetical protein